MQKLQKSLVVIVVCLMLLSGVVFASSKTMSIQVAMGGIRLIYDGKEIIPQDVKGNPIEPLVYNGTTYLPVRAVANAFGKSVKWDQATQSVIFNTEYDYGRFSGTWDSAIFVGEEGSYKKLGVVIFIDGNVGFISIPVDGKNETRRLDIEYRGGIAIIHVDGDIEPMYATFWGDHLWVENYNDMFDLLFTDDIQNYVWPKNMTEY